MTWYNVTRLPSFPQKRRLSLRVSGRIFLNLIYIAVWAFAISWNCPLHFIATSIPDYASRDRNYRLSACPGQVKPKKKFLSPVFRPTLENFIGQDIFFWQLPEGQVWKFCDFHPWYLWQFNLILYWLSEHSFCIHLNFAKAIDSYIITSRVSWRGNIFSSVHLCVYVCVCLSVCALKAELLDLGT